MGKKATATQPVFPDAKPGDVITWVPQVGRPLTYDERMYGYNASPRTSTCHVYLGRLRSSDQELIVARGLASGNLLTLNLREYTDGTWKVHGSNEDVQLTLVR